MPKLRNSTKNHIEKILEKTRFSNLVFRIDYNDSDTKDILTITFLPNPDFKFIATKANNSIDLISIQSPGKYLHTRESFIHNSFDDCFGAILEWADRIYEDYNSNRHYSNELNNLADDFIEKIKKNLPDPDELFTENEINELKEKLDSIAKKLEQQEEKTFEIEEKLRDAFCEIENLKRDLPILPKLVWYSNAAGRLNSIQKLFGNVSEKSIEVFDAIKGLLT